MCLCGWAVSPHSNRLEFSTASWALRQRSAPRGRLEPSEATEISLFSWDRVMAHTQSSVIDPVSVDVCMRTHMAKFSQTTMVCEVMVKGKVQPQVTPFSESLPIAARQPLRCKAKLSCKILHKLRGLRSRLLGQGLACGRDSVGPRVSTRGQNHLGNTY